MTRTIITLPHEIKRWLDDYSKKLNRPTAETIREALCAYKEKIEKEKMDPLKKTSGLWKDRDMDGLEYVNKLRDEWE